MTVTGLEDLACPIDGLPLEKRERSRVCAAGHSFDMARQGYINLLPVQHKRSRDPGDSKPMVSARRRFLSGGYFEPVAVAVADYLLETVRPELVVSCLDAGCGEGYYLRQLARSVAEEGQPGAMAMAGLDISKWAVQAAAAQDKRPTWLVGTNAKLPVLSGTLDWVTCIFGFPVYSEFARVIRRGGSLLIVAPGPKHLRELRELIYSNLKPKRDVRSHEAAEQEGFQTLSSRDLSYSIDLTTPQQIADLLMMTPHLYRAPAEGRARAAQLESISLTIDVKLTRLGLLAP